MAVVLTQYELQNIKSFHRMSQCLSQKIKIFCRICTFRKY